MSVMLPAGAMRNLAEYDYSTYCVQLPPGIAYQDIFRPVFWAHHPRLKKFDCIRLIAHDWSFDVTVTVVAKTVGGANVQLTPLLPAEPGEIERKEVPRLRNGKLAVRVEYQKATNWRVIGLDGSEHSRNHESKGAAEAAMMEYVHALGMVMPDDWRTDVKVEAPATERQMEEA